ncbi:MAG: right-handed parallel beta-helix repeat-containing protein, partial [Candidatus Hodarchaeales archaeon]
NPAYYLNKNDKYAVLILLILFALFTDSIHTQVTLDTQFQSLESTTLSNNLSETKKRIFSDSPISISGNEDFIDTVERENWPGNGTINNPYLIEDLQIIGFSSRRLIEIFNVDLHFRISNNLLSVGWVGIYFLNVRNGIIENNTVTANSGFGISIYFSQNSTIVGNIISNNRYGIWLDTSPGNLIAENVLENNDDGLYLSFSEENEITKNLISHSTYDGIYLLVSRNSFISENIITNNDGFGLNIYNSWENWILNNSLEANGINIFGSRPEDYEQREVVNNTINKKPLIFWQNKVNGTVPTNAGQIILINSSQTRIINQSIFNASIGVLAAYSSSLIIQNVTSSGNSRFGIHLYYSKNAYIANNTVSKNFNGIYLYSSENSSIHNNYLFSNQKYGIRLSISSNSSLSRNLIVKNEVHGIWLSSSKNNKITNNEFVENGLYMSGTNIGEFLQDQVENNYVNGKFLIFWQNIQRDSIPEDTGQVILVNSSYIDIINLNLSHTSTGVLAFYSSQLILKNNLIKNNKIYGIHLLKAQGSMIANNSVSSNSDDGIYLISSDDTNISGNTIFQNNGMGIQVYLTNRFEVSKNYIYNNSRGIGIFASNNGNSFHNVIQNNRGEGIWILRSWRNSFARNNVSRNIGYGIYNVVSGGNLVEWNLFEGNNPQGYSQAYDSFIDKNNLSQNMNIFRYNYWDDLIPVDKDNDGFNDEPYFIEGVANNQDIFPLISPKSMDESSYRQKSRVMEFPIVFFVLLTLLLIVKFRLNLKK